MDVEPSVRVEQPAHGAAEQLERQQGPDRRFRWVTFALTWLALVATGAADQIFDSVVYVASAQHIVDGTAAPETYGYRGALTAVVYLPSALAAKVGLPVDVGVLVQNAALLAAMGAFLLPALLRTAGVRSRSVVVACSALVVVVLGRFAPAGLMDIWAVAAVLLAAVLVARPHPLRVLGAGVLIGAAVNLRPAYLLPMLVVLLAWAVWMRRRWLWLALGSTTMVLPQVLLEVVRPGSLGQWWDGVRIVSQIQVTFAAWVIRYDTVPSSGTPQQFFCEPDMAAVQHPSTASAGDFIGQLVTSMPQSIDLLAQKWTAWLLWTWSTPFYDTFDPVVSQLSVIVVVLVVMGVFGWVRAARRGDLPRPTLVLVAALAVGVMGGAVTATPEARFAMPLVALGIVGVLLVRLDELRHAHVVAVAGVVTVILVLGARGLSHPAPPGPVTPDICATAAPQADLQMREPSSHGSRGARGISRTR